MPESLRFAVLVARMALVAGLAASAYGGWMVQARIQREDTQQFRFSANQVALQIAERLQSYEMILRGAAGLFLASDEVDRQEWARFVEEFQAHELVPGVQGIGFAVVIPPEHLAAHEAAVRSEGFPGYRVHPAGARGLYSSIVYIEPFNERNRRAFGYDMYSEPVRRAAMEQARDTGQAALSGKVRLVQETAADPQAGTLMFVPVYRRGQASATVDQRREALVGWAYSPYRMDDLMAGLLKGWQTAEGHYLHLRVYDGLAPAPESLLFQSGGGPTQAGSPVFLSTRMDFRGHPWLLEFSRSAAAPGISYWPAWAAAGGGVALSVLLYGLLMSLARTRERGLKLAHTLTDAIHRREKQLEESEFRWRYALEGNGEGIWDWNMVEDTVWYSRRYGEILGYDEGELGEQFSQWPERIHPEDRERALADMEAYLHRKSATFASEYRMRRKDGSYIWILDRGLVVERSESGASLRMIGTHADTTARKELDTSLRHSRAELEEAQRIAEFASWTLDFATARVTWTPELFRMLRLPATPDGAAPSFEQQEHCFAPESYQRLVLALQQLSLDGTPYEAELEMIRADGSRGWMQVRGEPVRSADGHVTGIHGVAADITERKQARLRIEQLNRLYAALSECNWAIVHCASEAELLERVCEVMVRHGGIDTAWVGSIDTATGVVTPTCARGEGAAAVGELRVSVDPGEAAGKGPIGTAAREVRPVWVDDFAANPLANDWQSVGERFGWRGVACLPLLHRRSPFAVLTLLSTQSDWASPDTRQLVEQIGSNVNFALQKLGAETESEAFRRHQLDSEQHFRELMSASQVGAFIVQEGVVRHANRSAGEMLGVADAGMLIGRKFADVAGPMHRAAISEALSDLVQGRVKVLRCTLSTTRPDGSSVGIVISATMSAGTDLAPIFGLVEVLHPGTAPPVGP